MLRFVFVIVLFVVLLHAIRTIAVLDVKQCRNKANVTENYLRQAVQRDIQLLNNTAYTCYMICTVEMGHPNSMWHDNGTINAKKIDSYLDNMRSRVNNNGYNLTENDRELENHFLRLKKCQTITGRNFCDSVIRVSACIANNESKIKPTGIANNSKKSSKSPSQRVTEVKKNKRM